MTTNKRIRPWRRVAEVSQAFIIIGLPFLRIGGQSALRFDVPSLQLHFFGSSLRMDEMFIVLIATIFLSLLFILVTLLFGRVWCGWSCPQSVLADFTSFVIKSRSKSVFYKAASYTVVALISLFVSANLIWYVVSPYDFIPDFINGEMGGITSGSWVVIAVIIFLNLMFLRQDFCATVCPYSKIQSTLYDSSTLNIAFDERRREDCIDCLVCVKSCPVGVDLRDGMNVACMNCAECIDACAGVMERRKKNSLFGYFFGIPGEGVKIVRQNAIMIGTLTAAFMIFFLYLIMTRVPVDLTILRDNRFQPRITSEETVINLFILSINNRKRDDVIVNVKTERGLFRIKLIPPAPLNLKPNESLKVKMFVSASHNNAIIPDTIPVSLYYEDGRGIITTKEITFIKPEAK